MNSALLSELFVRPVSVCVADPQTTSAPLFAEERAFVATAVARRRAQFGLGRTCARAALARLGGPDGPIPAGPDRAPVWPKGYVGSISHCDDFCCAVVAQCDDAVSVGVDVERGGELAQAAAHLVLRPEEMERASALTAVSALAWAKVAFSAKEAFYKCYYPLTRARLEFHDVSLGFSAHGDFAIRLAKRDKPLARSDHLFEGRWRLDNGRVYAGVTAPADRFSGRGAD
ncbi:MAG: 4'-phosphopantetheinyl transferase [Caulobacterales bacterium]